MRQARRYLPRLAFRLGMILSVLWGACTITFIVVKLIPGDPVAVLTGGENVADPSVRQALIARFGLNEPLPLQYLHYLAHALSGNFGESYQYRQPVLDVVGAAAVPPLQLAGSALLLAFVIATASAIATAGRLPWLRGLLAGAEMLLLSTPVYWIGIVLLSLFSFDLHWFPVTGNDGWRALVLPAVTLSLPLTALLAQVLRDGLEEALAQPFALTVRSRGSGETRLRLVHALRHAALATTTFAGTLTAGVLTGSVITETIFGRAGIGQITLQAIKTRDMPLILGLVMLSALVFVLVNLAVDALALLIDPRLRRAVS